MSAWPCAWCGRGDLETVAWGFTMEGRACCGSCAEREGVKVHRWMQMHPSRVVTDFGDAEVDDESGIVTLSLALVRKAALVGIDRRLGAVQRGRRNAHGFTGGGAWDIDIEGAAAELAACVWLGLPWEPVVGELDTLDGDLGNGRQVRSTRHEQGHLLLHGSDADDHRFVLVVGKAPRLRVVGWCLGREGKVSAHWKEPEQGRPCFMVPQTALRPLPRVLSPGESPSSTPRPGRQAAPQGRTASSRDMPGVSDDSPF